MQKQLLSGQRSRARARGWVLGRKLAQLSGEKERWSLELCCCQEAQKSSLAQEDQRVWKGYELAVIGQVVVMRYCEIQEGRWELEGVVGTDDVQGLVESLDYQEGRSTLVVEVHKAEILGRDRSLLEAVHILFRIVLVGSSLRTEEGGDSLGTKKGRREVDLAEVDLVAMRSELSRKVSQAQ